MAMLCGSSSLKVCCGGSRIAATSLTIALVLTVSTLWMSGCNDEARKDNLQLSLACGCDVLCRQLASGCPERHPGCHRKRPLTPISFTVVLHHGPASRRNTVMGLSGSRQSFSARPERPAPDVELVCSSD
jgi:hypothetical protein